jgi:hypothetical protein
MENEPQFYYATEDIYAIAAELSEQGFEEQESLFDYDKCNSLFIAPVSKNFKFSKENVIEGFKEYYNVEKVNLKTIEQWQTK